jgi:hypothetical protein
MIAKAIADTLGIKLPTVCEGSPPRGGWGALPYWSVCLTPSRMSLYTSDRVMLYWPRKLIVNQGNGNDKIRITNPTAAINRDKFISH